MIYQDLQSIFRAIRSYRTTTPP